MGWDGYCKRIDSVAPIFESFGFIKNLFQNLRVVSIEDIEDILVDGAFKVWRHADNFDPQITSLKSFYFVVCDSGAKDLAKSRAQKTRALEVRLPVNDWLGAEG